MTRLKSSFSADSLYFKHNPPCEAYSESCLPSTCTCNRLRSVIRPQTPAGWLPPGQSSTLMTLVLGLDLTEEEGFSEVWKKQWLWGYTRTTTSPPFSSESCGCRVVSKFWSSVATLTSSGGLSGHMFSSAGGPSMSSYCGFSSVIIHRPWMYWGMPTNPEVRRILVQRNNRRLI